MIYDFIEIGTSDFDALIESCDEKEIGLSIEPLKYYLDNLPDRDNVTKINCGVSDMVGTLTAYYIPHDKIIEYNLPDWVRGCNSIGKIHASLNGEVKLVDDILKRCLNGKNISIKDLVVEELVNVINCEKLISDNNVGGIKYLKIDTEGHDIIILKDYLKNCDLDEKLLADKIQFESNALIPKDEVDNIIKTLEGKGYTLKERGHETIMTKRLLQDFLFI